MRSFLSVACSVGSILCTSSTLLSAQVFVGGAASQNILITNGVAVGSNSALQVNPRAVAPNLAASNTLPAISPQDVRSVGTNTTSPVINRLGASPALGPQRGFNTGLGQQGSGTAIGQQGSGTALGQQGSGTAIGQQGVGTAIIPPNNGVVIGQPEPIVPVTPPPVATPPSTGFNTSAVPRAGGFRPAATPAAPAINPSGPVLPPGKR